MNRDPFPEEAYLAANPDVAAAVKRKEFKSGEEHYRRFGIREGRRGVPTAGLGRQIFFCHIPKTAGTSVRVAIEAWFEPYQIMPDAYMMARRGGKYPPLSDFMATLSAQREGVQLFRGHYPMAAAALLPGCLTVTILREPVARTISHLQHLISQSGRTEGEIGELLDTGQLAVPDNIQTRMLADRVVTDNHTGGETDRSRQPVNESHLEEALKRLKQVDIVGFSENIPQFVERFRDKLGAELTISHRNASSRKLQLSERQMDTIRKHNALDAQLYEAALAAYG